MGLILFGSAFGLFSALVCAIFGNITLGEAALIYWIAGTTAPVLHATISATAPAVSR